MASRKEFNKKFLIFKIVLMTSLFWIFLDGVILYNLIDSHLRNHLRIKYKISNSNMSMNNKFLNKYIINKKHVLGKRDSENLELENFKILATQIRKIIDVFKINSKLSTSSNFFWTKQSNSMWFVEKYFNKSTNPIRYFLLIGFR
jgi:hypothetical protein